MRKYQSFYDRSSSDSEGKWARFGIPKLTGSFLDIGCNEGFMCHKAKSAGADIVVGIDSSIPVIKLARKRCGQNLQGAAYFRAMDWKSLFDKPACGIFDTVLASSCMHYCDASVVGEDGKHPLIHAASISTRPGGLFVLECGIAPGDECEWKRIKRPVGDTAWHPTVAAVEAALNFSFSSYDFIGKSVNQKGDRVDRFVYHAIR